jgi:hypothetical protein
MRFARLFTPLILATALVGGTAAVPAAHAALPDSQMTYGPAKVFSPTRTVIAKSQRLLLTNLVNRLNTTETHQFTVAKGTVSQTSNALAFGERSAFTLWQSAGTGTYTIIESNGEQAVTGTIEVIQG